MLPKRDWMPEALVIGTWSSTCGGCGKGAFPDDKAHDRLAGYGPDTGEPGCGVAWRYVTSDYAGPGIEERVREMRPDLEWHPMFPSREAA